MIFFSSYFSVGKKIIIIKIIFKKHILSFLNWQNNHKYSDF